MDSSNEKGIGLIVSLILTLAWSFHFFVVDKSIKIYWIMEV